MLSEQIYLNKLKSHLDSLKSKEFNDVIKLAIKLAYHDSLSRSQIPSNSLKQERKLAYKTSYLILRVFIHDSFEKRKVRLKDTYILMGDIRKFHHNLGLDYYTYGNAQGFVGLSYLYFLLLELKLNLINQEEFNNLIKQIYQPVNQKINNINYFKVDDLEEFIEKEKEIRRTNNYEYRTY